MDGAVRVCRWANGVVGENGLVEVAEDIDSDSDSIDLQYNTKRRGGGGGGCLEATGYPITSGHEDL